jgi:hypothetical protein
MSPEVELTRFNVMSTKRLAWMAKCVKIITINLVILVFLVFMVEGFSSYALFFRDVMATYPMAERLHTQYDRDLGWSNVPNVRIPDIYGPGLDVSINGQGFRNRYDFSVTVPDGMYRVICSGDSFTFGYGVSNDQSWCDLLREQNRQLESINMGEGGYGADQAYLWFRRDGVKFQHQLHLFAFIAEDFRRMQSRRFAGYPKPVIDIENGSLIVRNVPVPKLAYSLSWFVSNLSNIQRLSTVAFIQRASEKLSPRRAVTGTDDDERTKLVLQKIFSDLKRLNEKDSAKLVLVYLPSRWEVEEGQSGDWPTFIRQEAAAQGIPLIDVLRTFQLLPEAPTMFIAEGQLKYPGAAGHLTAAGNRFVAKEIYEGLKDIPGLLE